jgi:hypothetical protein
MEARQHLNVARSIRGGGDLGKLKTSILTSIDANSRECEMTRFTIRELLLITAFLATSCAALKYAGNNWWAALFLGSFLAVIAAGVIAIAERGQRQAVAAGFVFCFCAYAIAAWSDASRERLPTALLLRRLYPLIATSKWLDMRTNEVVLDYDPQTPSKYVTIAYEQSEYTFRDIGHLLFALVFGYFGARFASWIYLRREMRERKNGTSQ